MDSVLSVRNWDKWQSYRRDRGQPPWIKVHRCIMRDLDWVMMTDAQRGQLVAMWLLAADHDGVIPASPVAVQKLCHMNSEPDLKFFIDQGFLCDDDSVASEWRQHDEPETETETETEKKTHRSSADASDRFKDFWDAYPKKVKKAESLKVWKSKRLNGKADEIIEDVNLRKRSDRRWLDGFRPDPTTYLRGERWNDEIEGGQQRQDDCGEWGLE